VVEEAASNLALAISGIGDILPDPPALFDFQNPRPQAAMLIAALIRRLSSPVDRRTLAENILSTAQPILFAADCLRWLRTTDEERPDPRAFSETEKRDVGLILATRIADIAATDPILVSFKKDAPGLFYLWSAYGIASDVTEHLSKHFEKSPSLIVPFLRSFAPTAWGMESGLPHESNFERSQYDNVVKLVPADAITLAIRSALGDLAVPENYPYAEDTTDDRDLAVARQFLWLHRHVLAENERGANDQDASASSTSAEDQVNGGDV
jgi:hypothetical protein